MYLTVIIPAYNEETRLPGTIREVVTYLSRQDYSSEVVVVENGSTDRTTAVAIKHLIERCAHHDNVVGRILHSSPGKGAAVRLGLQHARGQWAYLCDVDLSTPIGELDRFLTCVLCADRDRRAIQSVRMSQSIGAHYGRCFWSPSAAVWCRT